MAPENPPPVDPADLSLLMSPEQLRNPAPKNANVSFLRRTQYISSGRAQDGSPKSPFSPAPPVPAAGTSIPSRPAPGPKTKFARDDPVHVKKYIQKGFDIAYPGSKHTGEDTPSRIKGLPPTKADIDAWANPVHPDNPKLKPVGFYPVIPDLNGFPDPGGYLQFKFDKPPTQLRKDMNDERMDVGVLYPSAPEERVCQDHAAKEALHKANPDRYPDPGPIPWDYDLFLPENAETTQQIKNSLDVSNPNRVDESNYTHENTEQLKYHRYDRVRTYATAKQLLNTEQRYKDIALTLFDPDEATEDDKERFRSKQKGAYYYPIIGKSRLKPERARTIAQAGLAPTQPKSKEDQIHQLQVVVRDPDETETYKRAVHRGMVDSEFAENMPSLPQGMQDEGNAGDEQSYTQNMDVDHADNSEDANGIDSKSPIRHVTVEEDKEADA